MTRSVTVLLVILSAMIAGCASVPETPPPSLEDRLIPGHSAYFGLNVAENRELVSYLAGSMGFEADVVVNRVDLVAASLDTSVDGSPEFHAVALGRFPSGATRFALWKDRGFRRTVQRPGRADESGEPDQRFVYYRQVGGPVEIAVPESGVILISSRSVSAIAAAVRSGDNTAAETNEPGPQAVAGLDPEVVGYLRRVDSDPGESASQPGAGLDRVDIVAVLPDPAATLESTLGLDLPRFPIVRIALLATAIEDATPAANATSPGNGVVPAVALELEGEFELVNETQAAIFGRLGRVFVLAFVRALGIEDEGLRDNVLITVEGTRLIFGGVRVGPDDLRDLTLRLTGQAS